MNDREKVRNYMASYRGIDGGNPNAPVWICGIEHGGKSDRGIPDISPEARPGSWTEEFKKEFPDFSSWPYHQKVAKLMVALRRSKPGADPHGSVDGWRQYLAEELYVLEGETFKLNLFPLASPRDNDDKWFEDYGARIGMTIKDDYRALCRGARFDFLRGLREHHRPRLVLGTGRTYREDFAAAFGFAGRSCEQMDVRFGSARRECFVYRDEDGTLVVCPFLGGRNGVNSHGLIWELSRLLRSELERTECRRV